MSAVWKRGPSDMAQRFVLLTLADRANAEGYCWPSYKDIADRCAMSRSTAIRAVRALEAEGWVTRVTRWRDDRPEQTSNGYYINMERLGVVAERHHPSGTVTPPSSTVTLGVVAERYPNPQLESSIKSKRETSVAEAERGVAAAAAINPRLQALGLGTNARTLALLKLPHFDDDYAAGMVAWAERNGRDLGLAIKKIEDGDPVPGQRERQIPADLLEVITR